MDDKTVVRKCSFVFVKEEATLTSELGLTSDCAQKEGGQRKVDGKAFKPTFWPNPTFDNTALTFNVPLTLIGIQ